MSEKYKILDKWYSKERKKFAVSYELSTKDKWGRGMVETKVFNKFVDFADFLNNDLSGADLYDYKFSDVKSLEEYNIENAKIRSDVLEKFKLYDDKFYKDIIESKKDIIYINTTSDLLSNRDLPYIEEGHGRQTDLCKKYFFYISDIHLEHKIHCRFPNGATKKEIIDYIKELVKDLVKSIEEFGRRDYLLIGGDVCHDIFLMDIFFEELKVCFPTSQIIVILGNHELWNTNSEEKNTVEDIIEDYRKFFESKSILFLYNEMLVIKEDEKEDDSYDFSKEYRRRYIVSEKEIMESSIEELKDFCKDAYYCILGGIGFSGYCKKFNSTNGLYADTINDLSEDIYYTQQFENLYLKIKKALYNNKVIIFTHMPKEDWSKDEYCENWIYVNGHTHINHYDITDKTIYADNQCGYTGVSIGLKWFEINNEYEYFREYSNGIYRISKEQYANFYYGYGKRISFKKMLDIYMLKVDECYCFLAINPENEKMYLLEGGAIRTANKTIKYYYDNLKEYCDAVSETMFDYNKYMNQISDEIKKIDGDGKIHGCIIDIDYYNHIYVNPNSGELYPYYATSMTNKYIYKNIENLLKSKLPHQYEKYINLSADENKLIISQKIDSAVREYSGRETSTAIYSVSNKIKKFQFIANQKIVREWNDSILVKHQMKVNESRLANKSNIEDEYSIIDIRNEKEVILGKRLEKLFCSGVFYIDKYFKEYILEEHNDIVFDNI